MAHTIPFDTLAFAKELETAGVPPAQAEAHAKVMAATIQKVEEFRLEELATKGDIFRLERDIKELDTKMETRFREMDAKLKEQELRMVIKMGAMILGGIGILFGLMRVWPLPVQYVPAPGQEMRYMFSTTPPPVSQPPAANTGK